MLQMNDILEYQFSRKKYYKTSEYMLMITKHYKIQILTNSMGTK